MLLVILIILEITRPINKMIIWQLLKKKDYKIDKYSNNYTAK